MTDPPTSPQGRDQCGWLTGALAESGQMWGLAESFVRQLPETVAAMEQALRAGAYEAVCGLAAGLRDSGQRNGFAAVVDRAMRIEQAARDHAAEEIARTIGDLTRIIDEMRDDPADDRPSPAGA